jgi:hypothetical protein
MRMTVALLYLAGCPNYLVADQRLREALVAVGRAGTEVEHVLVSTDQEAEVLSFHGSPTVLVDGLDPFAAADAPVALACRLYRTETGVAGSPHRGQLTDFVCAPIGATDLTVARLHEATRSDEQGWSRLGGGQPSAPDNPVVLPAGRVSRRGCRARPAASRRPARPPAVWRRCR